MLYEIRHRYTSAVLFALECESLTICIEAAVAAGANLAGASLVGANLGGANLAGANIIDAGQDRRGFRFWAWQKKGSIIYRAGCHEWISIDAALYWYSEAYLGNGDRHECAQRLMFLRDEATRRVGSCANKDLAP